MKTHEISLPPGFGTGTSADINKPLILDVRHFHKSVNNISHARITKPAFNSLVDLLESDEFGNTLSADHKTALMALIGTMTEMAQGELTGRWAFGLPTGMGKTKSIEAWIAAINNAEADHISVAVAASKVEALCDMKRNLLELGVPAEKIGLVHSKRYDPTKAEAARLGGQETETYASEPSEGTDRQFMLVTHQRVRGCSLDSFHYYQGRSRDVLLYDESLIVSDSLGIPINSLKGAVGYLKGKFENSEKHAPLIEYLTECESAIVSELENPGEGGIIRLPQRNHEEVEAYRKILGRFVVLEVAHQLLDIADQDIRVIPTAQGGVVWYQVSVPKEVENILVLDASQPIRKLVHLDPTIKDAQAHLPQIQNIGIPLSHLKKFDRVTIKQMFAGGGRESMKKNFSEDWPEDRKVSKAIIDVVKAVPQDEAVLIFTYKTRPSEKIDYRQILINDMSGAGIDTSATVETKAGLEPRINVVTWGMETALNCFAYCSHVVLAGVLQRNPVDIAAAKLGQTDTLTGSVDYGLVKPLLQSEVCHMIYQALSRGRCRVIDNGHAETMTAHIIHRDDSIQQELKKVMPGANWGVWGSDHYGVSVGVTARLAIRITDYLSGLPENERRVSIKSLKASLGVKDTASNDTFQQARDRALQDAPWRLEKRTLVRLF